MGRGVEDAIMGFILNEAKKEGVSKIRGQYVPTKKNKPCEDFLPNYGFEREGEYWIYRPSVPAKVPNHLELLVE